MDFFDASGAVIGSAIGGVLAAYGAYTGVGMLASTAGGVAIAKKGSPRGLKDKGL
ncbi:hypothetical protein VN1180_07490 [Helicobacter pylori]|nr:hypothetical protein VN1180_07490 [Helicobacter pylori]